MNRTVLILVMCFFVVQINAQNNLTISFGANSPTRIDGTNDVELHIELIVDRIELMDTLIVTLETSGTALPKVLNKLSVLQVDGKFYLSDEQPVFNGLIKYYTNFYKSLIRPNDKLVFYAIDKSGVNSNKISYSLNP